MDEPLARLLRAAATIETKLGIRTCLIGGLSRGAWAEARSTLDVDVIVDTADLSVILERVGELGLTTVEREVHALAPAQMTRLRLPDALSGETRLDVIARSHEYYGRLLDRSVSVTIDAIAVRVARAEDIIVLKLLADRPQDRVDIDAILVAQGSALDRDLIEREAAALELELPERLRR